MKEAGIEWRRSRQYSETVEEGSLLGRYDKLYVDSVESIVVLSFGKLEDIRAVSGGNAFDLGQ